MAKGPKNSNPEKQVPDNIVPIAAAKCSAEGCTSRPSRAGFCEEHYTWFKEGLLTIDGYKAKDFEKKYHTYMRKKAA